MTTPHKATPEQWKLQQDYADLDVSDSSCIPELRDRLAAAEQRISELEQRSIPGSIEPAAGHFRDATEMVATDEELIEAWTGVAVDGSVRLRTVYNLGRQHGAAQVTCPHITTSDEGTSYCRLAEQGNSSPGLTGSPAPADPRISLVATVDQAMSDARTETMHEAACTAILAVAEWLDTRGQHACSLWLREEVERG